MRLEAQAFVRARLETALADATVRVKVPDPRPETFVLVKREGGGKIDPWRDGPGIGVTCWAPTEAEAAKLALRASAAMLALERVHGVASVTEESLYSDPDPVDSNPRWYGSYTLITYQIEE